MGAYVKAILAFLVPGLTLLGTASGDGLITWPEIFAALGASVVAGGAVLAAPNAGFVRVDKLPPAGELAQEAYEAYAQAVGGRSVNGDTLPEWGLLTATIRDAWTRAQGAVLSVLRR